MNLASKVAQLIMSDMDYKASYDITIERVYGNLSEDEKSKVNYIFATLCGYELGTILANEDASLLIDLGLD